jgi:hypothetical protein
MCWRRRCSQLHEAPVKAFRLLLAFMVLSLFPVRGLTPRICTPDEISTATAFLGDDNNVFLQFSGLLRSPINHFLPEDFSPGTSRVPEDFVVFGFAEGLQVSGDILQAGKIQIHINHFSVPCLQRISSRVPCYLALEAR